MTAGSSLSFGRPHIGSLRAALAAWLPAAIPFVFGALVTGLVAADHGGYWPTTWGWTTLALAWVAVVALVLGEGRPGGFELAWIAGLAAVTGWTAVTWLWTASQTQTALEVERTLTYLAVAIAAAAVVRRSGVEALVWGVWLGTTLVSLYALLTRLLPNRHRRDRHARRLPARDSRRLLERPGARRGDRNAACASGSSRTATRLVRPRGRGRVGADAGADAVLHVQPGRLDRPRRGHHRRRRLVAVAASARDRTPRDRRAVDRRAHSRVRREVAATARRTGRSSAQGEPPPRVAARGDPAGGRSGLARVLLARRPGARAQHDSVCLRRRLSRRSCSLVSSVLSCITAARPH